ncbi:MAG: hypothetical protein ACJ72Z_04200 [Pyrinomonadaceae bacterium]
MPRLLTFILDGEEVSVIPIKIDREKLYGSVEIEAFDEKGKPAEIKVLAADGKTLIDKGGTALATLDEKGSSVDRRKLKPVDTDGEPVETVPSSFNEPNPLKKSTADEYLSQLVKSVYFLAAPEGQNIDLLQDHLDTGQIYNFPFSYRGGFEYDNAFLIGSRSNAYMVVGKPADLQFVRLNQEAVLDSIEAEEISADDIDFETL